MRTHPRGGSSASSAGTSLGSVSTPHARPPRSESPRPWRVGVHDHGCPDRHVADQRCTGSPVDQCSEAHHPRYEEKDFSRSKVEHYVGAGIGTFGARLNGLITKAQRGMPVVSYVSGRPRVWEERRTARHVAGVRAASWSRASGAGFMFDSSSTGTQAPLTSGRLDR